MKKIVITCLIVFCLVSVSYAQDYKTGIGLRVGPYNGLTVKHFMGEKPAFELILATRWSGFVITGLYEIHNQAFNTERLKWYYGFGGHIGFWNGDYTHNYWGKVGTPYTVVGIDGILGLEYSFTEVPINIGVDWKPAINIVGYNNYWYDGGALSIRYIF
ncbi:MAG: hypothetical protein Q7T72_13650 [Bacteroidales bacterium]|nr:hypothetical protein [Bacteroidales bacterium]MDP3003369.1 hypothetical protein [Bacteroidales bacterium]